LGLDEDAKLLITVATLKPQKGHRYLIDAARAIVQREPTAHLLFVGDGELRSVLEQQVDANGLAQHVHFLGSRRDVLELLLASDVFILPSLFEGLSVALLEAMASGIPVIATAVSGTTTVVNSDRVAMLVPPTDVDALAKAVIDLLAKSPDALQAQCAAAKERVMEQFSLDRQARNYIALYERLLAENSRQVASH
jgi:glycosyltransferase involved in cell wall biosynthesis